MKPALQSHELRIELTEDDRPEDRYSTHVNNARYFAFINRTFHGWYVAMGIRGGVPGRGVVMAHLDWDFLRQVNVPGAVLCKIEVVRKGRTSLEHRVEIWDLQDTPVLAGKGSARHVWIDRDSGKPLPWPDEILARCWSEPAQD